MKVRNMTNNHRSVPNQYEITLDNGDVVFQSYNSVIAIWSARGKVQLDKNYWDYSKTTGKYRNLFLSETKKETQAKIDNGTYILADLNS